MMPDNPISFYDPEAKPYGALSPYCQHWFFVEPSLVSWRSCHQYWLAHHFTDSDHIEAIQQTRSIEEAQILAAQWEPRQDWDEVKDHHLRLAIEAMFADNLHLQFLLADTGSAELFYNDPEDADWGTGPDGKGCNQLGRLLMELRLKFQEIQSDPTRLQCPHSHEPTRRQACIHLISQPPTGRPYYRYFPNEPGYFAIICPTCHDQPEKIAANLRTVCKKCYLDYLSKELGQIGVPQFLSRSSSLYFSHEAFSLADFDGVDILDIQPIEGEPGNCWLALTSKKDLVRIDFEQHRVKVVCTVPECKIDWRYKVVLHVSRRGQYAAVANLRGKHGIVLNLGMGKETLRLDRGDYHTTYSHFSIAFAEMDDKTILVHATDWNRLTISDPASGQELTAREVPMWQPGGPSPDHYLDYFHGRLVVSPDQEWIADWGWVWHPVGILHCWSLRKWLYENVWESEDVSKRSFLCYRSNYWDGPMCWIDSRRLIIWGYGEDEEDLIPAATIYDAHTATELFWFFGPVSNSQKIKGSGKNQEIEISIPGGKFVCDDYLFSIDSEAGMTIWDIETGERLFADPYFSPVGYHHDRKCFLSIQGNGVFRISRLENNETSRPTNSIT